jgi:hypothetical protein
MQDIPTAPGGGVDRTRRSLLRTGLLGTLLLGGAGFAASLGRLARSVQTPAAGFRVLRPADVMLLRALIPGVLDTLLPADGLERDPLFHELMQRIDLGFYRLSPPARKTLLQLFDLLSFRFTRRALAGVAAWDQAKPAEIQAFLERWRTSTFAIFNGGYRVLVKMVGSAFYASRFGWSMANYPGPPPGPYQALNSLS